ncbi:Alpha-ketoglutarate-dependent dioxygenase alkB-like protein 4 [Sciurus carolinensis]|uniref:Alpha-ketoglutarate-dependent dioxygenase alkB-like protein 4 n=1 Tax=Sciurus carolinensis TaxID=30640 RepID=A0AA41MNL9_SCICA|nr:alpha-ketoglutarate-dependent dioxygenase alkB homolog 4 [Sciurus carolinensis]MBZ3875108.1 Alpha-ketoglutarate-dependent dioxygenase alkB-like protein 4 [Sciurus carolinensis]
MAAAEDPEVLQECGCKGIRTCLICEGQRCGDPPWQLSPQKTHHFLYCSDSGWAVGAEDSDFEGWAFPFPGVTLIEDFVTREEEAEMVRLMDCDPWKLSQSGRRKQDYGPKVNFRKQKLKTAGFRGLPSFSREVVHRMGLFPGLQGFQPVEQCNLDYSPERGSAIDPHLDDAWLWGERLVSLNLLSPTVVSMCREAPGSLLLCSAPSADAEAFGDSVIAPSRSVQCQEVEVAIPVPRRSLLVLTGAARHQWTHAIHRKHIQARRVCATFRELSAEFRPGGRQQELGRELLQLALSFQGRPV